MNKNCIFYNTEKSYAYVRGTYINKRYVKSLGISDFIVYTSDNNYTKMYLFESPIDILSFNELFPEEKGFMVSINSSLIVNKIPILIDKYKYDLKKIYCCFDNDEKGNMYYKKVLKYTEIHKGINCIRIKSNLKDFNEDLIDKKSKIKLKE